MNFKTLDDADLAGKRALVRVDLNLPMEDGKVTDTTRIDRILPTIREMSGKGAKVISITVERTLLARSDALAARLGVSRAGLVERGLRALDIEVEHTARRKREAPSGVQ